MAARVVSTILALAMLSCLVSSKQLGTKRQNPVTRVVELMQGLQKKISKDGKAEEEVFDAYGCWFKTTLAEKQASNAEAKDRIEAVNAYIDDVNSGRVEFSTERKDLTAEVDKLNAEIETANTLRQTQHEDYLAAKEEIMKAVGALEQAVEVLGAAAGGGSFVTMGTDLRRAVSLGKANLNENDARYLEHVLDGGVPDKADWKKLNKDATFKMQYKARSTKIQDILTEMLATFQDNEAEATDKEHNDATTHVTLMASKQSQLSAAQDVLTSLEGEGGLRGLSANEAQQQVEELEEQVESDGKYIEEAQASMAVKNSEWKERKKLRTEEVAAISKAIEVLSSDDARDAMSKSFKSQGASLFLSLGATRGCTKEMRRATVVQKLRDVASKHKDGRLVMLALQVQLKTKRFDAIISSIDKMVSDLHAEYTEDLSTKESCEQDRSNNSRSAKLDSQHIDDQTALIGRKQAEIEEKQRTVESIVEQVKSLELSIEEANAQRRREKLEYESAKADDEAASQIIEKATQTLTEFYEQTFSLTQRDSTSRFLVESQEPGEAPPPPPSTWSKPYGGSSGESNGIVSILEMLKTDIEKDIRVAGDMEEKAISEHHSLHSRTEELISSLHTEKADLEVQIGQAQEAQEDARESRAARKGVLEETLNVLRNIAPGCDFMAVNFAMRKANREAEIDGLYEAKAALQGGSFKLLQTAADDEC